MQGVPLKYDIYVLKLIPEVVKKTFTRTETNATTLYGTGVSCESGSAHRESEQYSTQEMTHRSGAVSVGVCALLKQGADSSV